jgi:hypothetical protein
MEYLTMLVFVANINGGEDMPFPIPFITEAQCEQALRASTELYKIFDDDWQETMVGCVRTDVVTGWTVRPKARPEHWSK